MNTDSQIFSTVAGQPYPVKAVLVLEGGLIVIRSPLQSGLNVRTSPRKAIRVLSRRSLIRLGLVATSTCFQYHSILTLTYGPNFPRDGKEVKRHIKRVIAWMGKRGVVDYLWFVEFQARGAPHIHMFCDFNQFQADNLRLDLALYWSSLVEPEEWQYCRVYVNKRTGTIDKSSANPMTTREAVLKVHSHPKVWEGLRSKDGAMRYAVKYATKAEQKKIPVEYANMGRFWATTHKNSLKNLVKFWIYTDEDGVIDMCQRMGREFSSWEYLPKIILGNTEEILTIIKCEV